MDTFKLGGGEGSVQGCGFLAPPPPSQKKKTDCINWQVFMLGCKWTQIALNKIDMFTIFTSNETEIMPKILILKPYILYDLDNLTAYSLLDQVKSET